jgi:SAM-dependent methyltransferase
MRQLQTQHQERAAELSAARQHIAGLDAKLATLTGEVSRLAGYFDARPYMAFDAYGTGGDLRKPMSFGLKERPASTSAPEFADVFRGPEEFIAQRQRPYLRFVKGVSKVVDLGSGRGEFLELLREEAIDAVGVELDAEMVERCRRRGLRAEHADAFDYLCSLEEASMDVVFSAQFVEHVESSRLGDLCALARSRLRDGGLFIAETVNPESYLAQKSFYIDLTHQRPIFPQVLLHICQNVGFRSARIFYPNNGGFTQANYRDAGEYAIIAVK